MPYKQQRTQPVALMIDARNLFGGKGVIAEFQDSRIYY